jgi:hypothetical protein
MDGAKQPTDGGEHGDAAESPDLGLPKIGRRRFAVVVGGGTFSFAAAALAAPSISTVSFKGQTQVGSPEPPGSTTTSTTVAGEGGKGKIAISDHAPCAGNDVSVTASGFAPKTAIAVQIDSAQYGLGVLTADAKGEVITTVKMPTNSPLGPHKLRLVGVAPGGKTLVLSAPVNIKEQGNCAPPPTGVGSTVPPGTPTTGGPTSVAGSTVPQGTSTGGPRPTGQGEDLPFTGTDSTDLAVIGAAAAVLGRALYGLAGRRSEDSEEETPE